MLDQNNFAEPNWHVLTFLHPKFAVLCTGGVALRCLLNRNVIQGNAWKSIEELKALEDMKAKDILKKVISQWSKVQQLQNRNGDLHSRDELLEKQLVANKILLLNMVNKIWTVSSLFFHPYSSKDLHFYCLLVYLSSMMLSGEGQSVSQDPL
jgi:hypothetical protein